MRRESTQTMTVARIPDRGGSRPRPAPASETAWDRIPVDRRRSRLIPLTAYAHGSGSINML